MTRRDPNLLLDALVREADGFGDWNDVLRRAGVTTAQREEEKRSRRGRRTTVVFAAIGVLLVALLATPAFGLREAVLDLFGRTDVEFSEGQQAPSVVRYLFEDLALGAPPSMRPQAIAAQTRKAGELTLRGKRRPLWIAPARDGGFCYLIEGAHGYCTDRRGGERSALGLTVGAGADRGGPSKVLSVSGTVHDARVVRLTIEFGDGATRDVPFVYVSEPIDAGFFSFDVPADRQLETRGPRRVVARDADGNVVEAVGNMPYGRPPVPPRTNRPYAPQTLPLEPPIPPSAPFQSGEANGVRVVAGANGAVRFDLGALDDDRRALLRSGASYGCFELVSRRGAREARGVGASGKLRASVGLRLDGLGAPLDGCEVRGFYGHKWPDRLASHSAIEIPFTPEARRYFLDRAAARNLALFVRSRAVKRIRRGTGADVAAALERTYGGRVSRTATPDAGGIGYVPTVAGVRFLTRSETGRRFEVIVEDGKIVRENVKPLALVF